MYISYRKSRFIVLLSDIIFKNILVITCKQKRNSKDKGYIEIPLCKVMNKYLDHLFIEIHVYHKISKLPMFTG
jgi:hypothetical protein